MTLSKTDVPAGTVTVRPHPRRIGGQRWFLIEIGRGRYVKRLNISDDEAAQLVARLAELARMA